ncbi:unnamed protein product [Prorocentrum cordatum]|uniref:Uncharacterized protein n=1 Tax=Prorocentrum cordatum TaxID=2364126 RepID=A0ABN9PXM1_9DINO|nr:unnamed protein product [Polarella glacialis]
MRWTAAPLAAWAAKAARGEPASGSEDDVSPSGPCQAALAGYCPTVPPGDGRLTQCLMNACARDGRVEGLLQKNGVTSECKMELTMVRRKPLRAGAKSSPPVGCRWRPRRRPRSPA